MRKVNQNYSKAKTIKDNKLQNTAYISLGSNKGDRANYLRKTVSKLNQNPKNILRNSSSVYETKPFGNTNQSNFLNAVIEIKTSYNLIDLFNFLRQLEIEQGRLRTEKWGPREIDLDILFFNAEIFRSEELTVPHLGITDRDFVLVPLKEIAPDYLHPALKKKISDICIENISQNIIRKTKIKIH